MDERRDTRARDDGANFAPAPIRAAGRPPILLAGLALMVGALVVLGAFDGLASETPNGIAESSLAAPAEVAVATRTPRPTRARPTRVPPPAGPASLVALDLRPAGSHLFVHGDVFSLSVIVVIVSLQDAAGHVSDVRSVKLQGGSTALRLGANAQFDVRFDVPDELMGEGLWVTANGYDALGSRLESVRQPVTRALVGAIDRASDHALGRPS